MKYARIPYSTVFVCLPVLDDNVQLSGRTMNIDKISSQMIANGSAEIWIQG